MNNTGKINAISDASRELRCMAGYPYSEDKDMPFIYSLHHEFPSLDLADEIRQWQAWLLDNGARIQKKKINYRARLRKWCQNSARWQKKRQEKGQQSIKKTQRPAGPQYEFEKEPRTDQVETEFKEIW